MDDVSASLESLLNTAVLGEGGVRAEFVDRFDAFQGRFEDFLGPVPDEFDDQAAAAETAVEAMSDELRSSAPQPADLAMSYAEVRSSVSALLDAVKATC